MQSCKTYVYCIFFYGSCQHSIQDEYYVSLHLIKDLSKSMFHVRTYLHQKETCNKGLQNYPDKSSESIHILFINRYYFTFQGLFLKKDAQKTKEKEINYKIFSF